MEKQIAKFNYLQNRREFVKNSGISLIGLFLSGIPLNALAYEKPTNEQIKKFVFERFERFKKADYIPSLLQDVKSTNPPFDYYFTKNMILRDYLLRWDISFTLSDLSEEQLIGIVEGKDAKFLYLWEPHQLKNTENTNLINTIKEEKLTIIQKPSEIKPIDPIEVSIDKQMKGETFCREVIIQIIFEAVTGVKIAKDKIAKFSSDFIDIIDCIVKALKQNNWNQFEYCIAEQLVPLIFSTIFLKLLREVLGKEAFKKLLTNTIARFVPIIGIAFFVFHLTLAIKGNWKNLNEICLN